MAGGRIEVEEIANASYKKRVDLYIATANRSTIKSRRRACTDLAANRPRCDGKDETQLENRIRPSHLRTAYNHRRTGFWADQRSARLPSVSAVWPGNSPR